MVKKIKHKTSSTFMSLLTTGWNPTRHNVFGIAGLLCHSHKICKGTYERVPKFPDRKRRKDGSRDLLLDVVECHSCERRITEIPLEAA